MTVVLTFASSNRRQCAAPPAGTPAVDAGRIASSRIFRTVGQRDHEVHAAGIVAVLLMMSPFIERRLIAGPRLPRLLMSARPPARAPTDRYSLTSAKEERRCRSNPDNRERQGYDSSDQVALQQCRHEETDSGDRDAQLAKCQRRYSTCPMPADQDHADDPHGVRDCRVDPDEEQVLDAPALDQCGNQNTIV